MGKGKRNHGQKELDQLQRIKRENDKLKRQISSLRKQLARIDLDRYDHIKNIIDEHLAQEDQEISTQDMLKSMKEKWRCRECSVGHLEIYVYTRQDGTFYYRLCNNCPNRTKSQRYDPNTVQGIMKDTSKPDKKSR